MERSWRLGSPDRHVGHKPVMDDGIQEKKIKKDISSPGNMQEAGRKGMERPFEDAGVAVRAARRDYSASSERDQLGKISK